jgi:hypothetical protein
MDIILQLDLCIHGFLMRTLGYRQGDLWASASTRERAATVMGPLVPRRHPTTFPLTMVNITDYSHLYVTKLEYNKTD